MTSNKYDGMVPTKCLYFIMCLSFIPLILTFSSLFVYMGFGIYFLVEDYAIRDYCPESFLWEYILVCVIFSPLYVIHYFLKRYTKTSLEIRLKIILYSVTIYLFIVIFGGSGLYDHSLACDSDDEDLWKFVYQVLFSTYFIKFIVLFTI